jgi:membrane associated rhomboid family serine protease
MGIYDREYYRGDGPSFLGTIMGQGKVTIWLIAINVVIFLLQWGWVDQAGHSPVTKYLELSVPAIQDGQVWRLLTYAFLHGGPWHIFWNMLFLWWFGREVEALYGSKEFLGFYLVAALVGGLVFCIKEYLTAYQDPMYHMATAIGASGAVLAVMVLFATHFPKRIIYIWFVLPVPVWLLVAFEVVVASWYLTTGMSTTTAVAVHLGGAAFGFLYYKTHMRVLSFIPNVSAWRDRLTRPRLKIYREDRPHMVAPHDPSREVDEHLEAEVDAVLEKVARHGQASLTERERQLLLKASEVYKKKRT